MEIKVAPDQPFKRASQQLTVKEILFHNFIGGIAWGIGATVGISLLFTILSVIAQQANLVPVFGSFISDVINFVVHTQNTNK